MLDVLRLLAVFALIVLLLRRHINLGLVMIVAAAVLGMLFEFAPLRMLEVAANSATQLPNISLIVALILIAFLENVMRNTGMLRRMVDSLVTLVGDRRVVMALLPAFIGFLPSAGGAVFSAPMVGEVTREMPMSPESKSFVNYWYRHIWEYVFPLYPGPILAAQILGVPLGSLLAAQLPLTLTSIVVGIPLALRGLGHMDRKPTNISRRNVLDVAGGMSPVLAVLVLVLGARLDLAVSLAIVVAALIIYNRYSVARTVALVREAFSFSIVVLVAGVMIFKDVLMASGATDHILGYLASVGVPSLVVILAFAFFVGVMTGYSPAVVSLTFPFLIGIGGGMVDLRLATLAYAAGFAGIMLSPMHLCLVLTINHFKASLGHVVRMMVAPEAAIVIVAIGYYAFR